MSEWLSRTNALHHKITKVGWAREITGFRVHGSSRHSNIRYMRSSAVRTRQARDDMPSARNYESRFEAQPPQYILLLEP
jgi:hypothetical protein